MKLVDLFKEERIIPEFTANNSSEALSLLFEKLQSEIDSKAQSRILEQLQIQEQNHPTLLNSKVWLPHLRAEGIKSISIVLGISSEGIEVKGLSVRPALVKLIFLVLTPQTENTMMLQTLAAIARLCNNRETLEALYHVRSPQRALRIIADSGIEVKRNIYVSDVMETNFIRLREKMTLRYATELLGNSGLNALPVVGDNDELLGELSLRDVVRLGLPQYISLLQDMSFIEALEPFEDFFRQEHQLLVAQIYSVETLTIEPERLILEGAHRLIASNRTELFVVQGKKILGILTLAQIIRKVFLL
ncbi:MAG: PTS sugar transporter subunit IIA [Candidatus Sumerlaeia bacterium]|nr:PTS sugar transporter subunit IIA [Candidatus Sumerlaeia bacterium]